MRIEGDLSDVGAASIGRVVRAPLSFAAVNGWRGPGALAIAVVHLGIVTDFFPTASLRSVALLVDLFFVLSGLVIAHAYAAKLARARNIPEYVVRRFGRIWPVQVVALAVLVAYELLKVLLDATGHAHFSTPPFARAGSNLVEAIPTNLLLLQSLGFHDRETWNFPSWSLSVEFACYLSFAAVCLLARPYRRALSVAAVLLSLVVLVFVAPDGMRSTFDYGVFRCVAGFFTGTLCYELVSAERIPTKRWPTLVEIGALVLLVGWMSIALTTPAGFAAPFVIAVFLLSFMGRPGRLSDLLATAPLQFLADLSFSIYMVHALVMIGLLAVMRAADRSLHLDLFRSIPNVNAPPSRAGTTIEAIHLSSPAAQWGLFLLYVALVFGLALLVYRFVEVPGRDLFTRWAKSLAPASSRRHRKAAPGTMETAP